MGFRVGWQQINLLCHVLFPLFLVLNKVATNLDLAFFLFQSQSLLLFFRLKFNPYSFVSLTGGLC